MKDDFDLDHHLATLRDHLPELMGRFQVRSMSIFGSYVRHEEGPESDLDILVSFAQPPGLLTFLALENHLTDLLGIKVDLVMKDALKPTIGRRILSEVVPV
ncbi:MAG: nucleotidyltransferase family protein [Acidobacteriota bacterium]